jgi:hypothetical protein
VHGSLKENEDSSYEPKNLEDLVSQQIDGLLKHSKKWPYFQPEAKGQFRIRTRFPFLPCNITSSACINVR